MPGNLLRDFAPFLIDQSMWPTGPTVSCRRGSLFRRNAVRAICVGLVVLPLLGTVAGASAEVASPKPAGSPSATVRLEYYVPQGRILEAGDALWFSIQGMPSGWDTAKVTSPALEGPIILAPVKKGATQSVQVDQAGTEHRIRSGLPAGTYPVTATSHGRTVATARLKVAAEGSAEISRFVIGPRDAFPSSDTPARVRPGSEVRVVLTDLRAAPKEESLTVTSPIFNGSLTIETGSLDDPGCKCDDGGTVYAGHTRLRDDVPKGRYTLTVVSHHGQQTAKQHVTVAGEPVAHGPSWSITAAAAAGGLALTIGAALVVRRRSRETATTAKLEDQARGGDVAGRGSPLSRQPPVPPNGKPRRWNMATSSSARPSRPTTCTPVACPYGSPPRRPRPRGAGAGRASGRARPGHGPEGSGPSAAEQRLRPARGC
ncbi:hypothetical protein [Streptomyces sp. NBC_01235]|uniref:hypothetical protein n=1 Tax=Streptomyces sp. NBC_01235 TaxID=2903788 RepID=UPI002E1271F9|nr:hypothetical protein OG289_47875 [Streptomyces sp. NBC_01235]